MSAAGGHSGAGVKPGDDNDGATRSRPRSRATIVLIVAALLPWISLGTCAAAEGSSSETGALIALAAFGAAVLGGLVLFAFVVGGVERRRSALALGVNAAGVVANLYWFITHFDYTRGRQLRGASGRVLPVRSEGSSVTSAAARAWRDNGDTEAASVAAFSLLSLELSELGAPLALIRAAHEDALDEIRHAELCYEHALALGDAQASVAPMPGLAPVRGRLCSLPRVAVESFVEGAYLEAVSAELAGALLEAATDAPTRALLEVIATDEARHARHAWAVVEWALSRDPAAVGRALEHAAGALAAPDPRADEPGSDGSLEPLGIAGRETQRVIATRCLATAKAQLARLLASAPATARASRA